MLILLSQVIALTTVSASMGSSNIRTVIDRAGKSFSFLTDDDDTGADNVRTRPTSNIVTVITSPGVPSLLLGNELDSSTDNNDVLPPLFLWDDTILVCQGATLSAADSDEATTTTTTTATCLSVCGSVSDVIVLEGIAMGDLETANGILNTRHARTLSYLFQSKKQQQMSQPLGADDNAAVTATIKKQTLILAIATTADSNVGMDDTKLINDIRTLYQVETVGLKSGQTTKNLEDVYDIQIRPVVSGTKVSACLLFNYAHIFLYLSFFSKLHVRRLFLTPLFFCDALF